MEELFSFYSNKIVRGTDEFRMFSDFFKEDRNRVEEWIDARMQKLQSKNDDRANSLRCQGNAFYTKRQFKKSLDCYTKALCSATYESESYSLILANRSAAFYMMEDYMNCLKDINFCMNCQENSDNIRLKIHIRKIKCCAKMNLQNQINCAVAEALDFLEKSAKITNKDTAKNDIIMSSAEKPASLKLRSESIELPKLKDGVNSNFLYASSAIRVSYDDHRGRHVVANKQLEPGDVLFKEKPFIFAPLFTNEDMNLSFSKCYHCLSTTFSCIPCKYCIRSIFCDEKCRDDCWNEFHKWECLGMQADLWYHIGIAFPALRALIKGVPSGFSTLSSDYKADTKTYGSERDNYVYFNKLVSNIPKMKNVLPMIISAAVITLYLKKHTKFFDWLLTQPGIVEKNIHDLVLVVGGRITKHIAQLQCNSSTINYDSSYSQGYENDSQETVYVACAIYPSVSMMNHSCKPNITMYYIQDIVIVQAAEKIEENEEIFNCYGISYRSDDRKNRQEQCKSLYYFKCQCRACKCPTEAES